MNVQRNAFRDHRGMASIAVLLFAIVAVFILVANFQLNYAVSMSGDAFDTFNSQLVEKNGIAQIVKESILAIDETATTDSPNSIQTEIGNRLSAMSLPAGVSITLQSAVAPPANPFFPIGTPAVASQLAYFSTSPRGIAGMGNLLTSLAIQGPAVDLGRYQYTFERSTTNAANEGWTYVVNADVIAVPLTNIDVIAYGLPATGTVPSQAPTVLPGTFGTGVSALVVTSNNPANDPTAFPDLYAPASTETLPYQFRNAVSYVWNAYEYLWATGYQDALENYAKSNEIDPGNQTASGADPTPPSGAVYDFSKPPFDPSHPGVYPCNPTISGVTSNSQTSITIDCGAIQSTVVEIVDSQGIGTVVIKGASTGTSPFILVIRNTAGSLGKTRVSYTGGNSRPAIFYLENCSVAFDGSQFEGALFFDPTTVASGSETWFGHFSFYGPNNPMGDGFSIAMNDDAAVKSALAALAPRVLLVSTTAIRQ